MPSPHRSSTAGRPAPAWVRRLNPPRPVSALNSRASTVRRTHLGESKAPPTPVRRGWHFRNVAPCRRACAWLSIAVALAPGGGGPIDVAAQAIQLLLIMPSPRSDPNPRCVLREIDTGPVASRPGRVVQHQIRDRIPAAVGVENSPPCVERAHDPRPPHIHRPRRGHRNPTTASPVLGCPTVRHCADLEQEIQAVADLVRSHEPSGPTGEVPPHLASAWPAWIAARHGRR